MAVDLHIHTTASDGSETPEEVVVRALNQGLEAIAITDHDTVKGIPQGIDAGLKWGMEVIPGIEINTNYHDKEVHVLGYLFDYNSRVLLEKLAYIQEQRTERIVKIVDKLNCLGIDIRVEDVFSTAGNSVPGRPHVARALVEKETVLSIKDAFDKYIGNNGPAYVPRYKLSPFEAVRLIKLVGGVPVLAHPGLMNCDELIGELLLFGLQGLEVYHPDHTNEQTLHYCRLAEKFNLVITGGSDYHGPEYKHRQIGAAAANYSSVKRLKELSVYYETGKPN